MVIHWERSSSRMLPTRLLTTALYQHTETSKMQVMVEEAQNAQSWKTNPFERNAVRWNWRLDWNAWLLTANLLSMVLNTNLKNLMFFCLNMLEIRIQTICDAKWSSMDSAVFQPFCCMSNVALRGRAIWANTADPVSQCEVHTQIHFLKINH